MAARPLHQRLQDLVEVDFTRPSRREAGWLLAGGVLVLAASMAALGRQWWRVGLLGEWATYMVAAFAILCWRPFRSALRQGARRERIAVVACFLLLALGQFVGGSRLTFPLVRFQMFTDPTPSVLRQYHFVGVTDDGETVAIDPVRLFPSLDRGRFEGKLHGSVEAALADGPGSAAAATCDGLLAALGHRFNLDARRPVVRLEVYAVDARLNPPPRDRVTAVQGVRVWSMGVAQR